MILQIGHSRDYDYINNLYVPIRQSSLDQEHEIWLPHEKGQPSGILGIL